jgi:hypothetical protein
VGNVTIMRDKKAYIEQETIQTQKNKDKMNKNKNKEKQNVMNCGYFRLFECKIGRN